MKTKNILIGVMAGVVALSSCKKDIPVAEKNISAPVIENPNGSSAYVLIPENDNGSFETFVWNAAYLGEGVEVSYEVQIDDAEGDFSSAQKLEVTKEQYKGISTGAMNQLLRDLGIAPNSELGIQARVVASGGDMVMESVPVSMLVDRYIYDDEIVVWGLVGSSVSEDHVPLVFDAANNVWKATMVLKSGKFLFKDKSYLKTTMGSDGSADGLKVDGDSIATENSVYAVELDLINNKFKLEKSNFPNNLYLVGAHQGWDNATASANKNFFDGTYEVYQYNADAFECKWLPQLGAWDNDLGDDPNNPGSIVVDGEQNLQISEGGLWYIKADLAAMKWEAKKTEWGIIGDSTPGSWDNQTNFTDFDESTNTFTMTIDLIGGKELKFRGTSDWSLNYGGSGLSGEPIAGGSNIVIADDGSYDITLVLGHGGNYSYSIVKK
ncbi:MAG: SusE domain-containing protein [Flavobacteriales bacterium]|nr:SusE domain-containing protein [Flavobacteriales bacterium]